MSGRMKRKAYESALEPLQLELNNLAHWLRAVPYRRLPEVPLALPPLRGTPGRERYTGKVRPIHGRH